jgi:hypothetical protein
MINYVYYTLHSHQPSAKRLFEIRAFFWELPLNFVDFVEFSLELIRGFKSLATVFLVEIGFE